MRFGYNVPATKREKRRNVEGGTSEPPDRRGVNSRKFVRERLIVPGGVPALEP